jgi:hypothetical protein
MAGTTGLEPATSAVTGQRSNQLSYVPKNAVSILAAERQELVYQILPRTGIAPIRSQSSKISAQASDGF